MAISFSGEFEVPRSSEQVYDFLTEPQRFAPLLPEFQNVSVQDPSHFTVKVGVGVSHIRGTADIKMHLSEAERPRRARYEGQGSVVAGNVNMNASFDLQPAGSGTRVQWKGEAQIFGRIISLAGGLLEPMAKKNLQKMIDSLRAALSESAPVPASAPAQEPAPVQPDGTVQQGQGNG